MCHVEQKLLVLLGDDLECRIQKNYVQELEFPIWTLKSYLMERLDKTLQGVNDLNTMHQSGVELSIEIDTKV